MRSGGASGLPALVARTAGLQPWRRVFHALNGLVVALAPGLLGLARLEVVAILAVALALAVAFDVARLRVPAVNAFFFRAFSALASPREARAVASSTWYTLGALLAWALFEPRVAVPAILVLALADPAASVLGRLFGRRSLGKGTVEGAAAFFAMALAVLAVTVGLPLALAGAVVATAVEVAPTGLDDNLTIPLATGGALTLLLSLAG